ncbi:MAG TPA: SH3 domain-containing protein [Saprospiraceae bacterium]|nr:SH3 domain-containing protein [Saprospiraceae bacterium]
MRNITLILYFFIIFLSISCKNKERQAVEPRSEDQRLYIFEDPEQFLQTQYYVWLPILKVREEPNQDAKEVAKLKKGDQVEYLGIKTQKTETITISKKVFEDNWMKIKTDDGVQGWVFGAGINIKDVKEDLSPTPYDDCFTLIAAREINDYFKCMSQVRKQVQKEQTNRCYFTANSITLSMIDGKPLKLINEVGDTKKSYNFMLYYPGIEQFVVQTQTGVLEEYLLIDAHNGNKITTWGLPKVSPGKDFIVSASSNYIFQGAPNGIQILQRDGKVIKKVWEREIESYEPYAPKWLDNNTIGVTLKPRDGAKKFGSKFALIRKESPTEWKMEY